MNISGIMTQAGKYINLVFSPYRVTSIDKNNVQFVFSSDSKQHRFISYRMDFIKSLSYQLKKLGIPFDNITFLAETILYGKIEKQNFLLVNKEGIILCEKREDLTFEFVPRIEFY